MLSAEKELKDIGVGNNMDKEEDGEYLNKSSELKPEEYVLSD